jgi:hypothetical protein
MKQFLLFVFSILFSLPIIAQEEHEATLYFLDGTDVTGYATLKLDKASFYGAPQDKIAFRVTKDEQADVWDQKTVSKVVFLDFDTPRTFEYVEIKYSNGTEITLLELIIKGEVNLYADALAAWNSKPKDPEEGSHKTPDPKYLKVKREKEIKLTILTGNKKKIAAYFNECPGIVERLETNVFNIGTLEDIVEYYNDLCSDNFLEAAPRPVKKQQDRDEEDGE